LIEKRQARAAARSLQNETAGAEPWSSTVTAIEESTMADSTKDKIQGAMHDAKGTIKEKVGQATNDPNMESEGAAEKVGGKVQKKVGDVEKVFNR
jgi:uncharacterized protein YjbJ (UPF0337 family)